jgi:hypothetical protein
MILRGAQTGRLPDGAVDIGDQTACPADGVMMVVSNPCLEQGGPAGWLDPPRHARGYEYAEHLVHGLGRDRAQTIPADSDQLVNVGVAVLLKSG